MTKLTSRLLMLLVAALLWLVPARAEAGGVVLITRGDTIANLGEIVSAQKAKIEAETAPGVKVGYVYNYFGLFWLDLWTWGGRYCVYKDKNFWDVSPAEAASFLGTEEGKLGKPFLYRFPPLLYILGIVAIGAGVVKLRSKGEGGEGEKSA
jgi:hypothetical protein